LTFDALSAPPILCGHGNMGGDKSAWASTKKSAVYKFSPVVLMCMYFFHAIVYDAVRYVCQQHIRALPKMSHVL